jgi:hypothetical protein
MKMPSFKGLFFSIILVGRQNPQILNHDFLVNHGVLPLDKEPFKELFRQRDSTPFTEFISTPLIASIKYAFIAIAVQESLYQIVDNRLGNPLDSPIIPITKKYFGGILRYTPFIVGGINFHGIINFDNREDEHRFDEKLGVRRDIFNNLIGTDDTRIGATFSFPLKEGVGEVQLLKPKDRSLAGGINFNYEFQYREIDSFLAHLDSIGPIYTRFNDLLRSLGVRSEP